LRAQFGQGRVGLPGHQRLQAIPAPDRQQRLATTPVSLRFQRPPGFEVLAHSPHGGHAVAQTGGYVAGAFALVVKVKYPLTNRNRNRFHTTILPWHHTSCKLHYLCKCSKKLNVCFGIACRLAFTIFQKWSRRGPRQLFVQGKLNRRNIKPDS
jgi:hypothetical protein